MSTLSLGRGRQGPIFPSRAIELPADTPPHERSGDLCGGENVIDFALCLVIAAAVVGLLFLAL